MKKMNKKGFTLIELLAVIIILGVLMIIAIPSVTSYIQNSRKSAFADSGLNYVKSGINTVNSGNKMRFYDTSTLYLIPAGHKEDSTCITLESGGQSPFSDDWAYAYVGVTYKEGGKGYTYYFIAEDAAGQGIQFLTQTDLQNLGSDAVYADPLRTQNGFSALVTEYAAKTGAATIYVSTPASSSEKALADIGKAFVSPTVSGYDLEVNVSYDDTNKVLKFNDATIDRVVVLKPSTCTYQEALTA